MQLSTTTTKKAFDYSYLTKKMFPYVKPYLFRIFLGFFLAVPLGLLDGVTAFVLKPYIDVVVNGQDWVFPFLGHTISLTRELLTFWIPPAIVVFALVQGLLKYFNNYLVDWVSLKISNSVKLDLFKKLTTLDSKFFDDNSSGIVLTRFLGDPDVASRTFVESIKNLITYSVSSLGLIFVLLINGWKLAIVAVVILCCAFLPVALIRKKIKQVSNDSAVLGGGINTNFNETYHGNKIMTGYSLQKDFNNRFQNQIEQSFDLAISLTKRVGWMSPLMYLIASVGVAGVMWYGNILLISGEMSTGALASFITSLLLLYKPVKELGNTLTNLQNIFVAMSRVFELFDLVPEIKENDCAAQLTGVKSGMSFENVCFEYVKGSPILKNITFDIEKGKTFAIVGNSGGGKSTLVNTIPRFYDIKSGSIKIDETDIRDFSLTSLRANISEVFQDNFLFSGTIRDNILMGKKDATDAEIDEVIKGAHLDDFINTLPNGLDSVIGERGTSLSGGQRQRVAIARAMIKNAPIIILDEATSALDNESEEIVQRALENLMKNKTVFVIAHRLSTIKNSDKILVINQGELVEAGTHDELLKIESGHYKHLYEMQFKKTDKSLV